MKNNKKIVVGSLRHFVTVARKHWDFASQMRHKFVISVSLQKKDMPRDTKRGTFRITPGETVTGKMVQTYDRQGAIKKEKIKSKSAKVTTKYNKDNSIKSVKVKRK